MLYAVLSDGTLVITSHGSTPTVGKWKYENGALTMIEQGQSYPTDIVVLSADQFTIRSHNPGTPVEITLERAARRSEEHTSELQSLMRTAYAVFCLKKKNQTIMSRNNSTK